MNKINVLPSEVYNKIAAGEVAERPASVVKELIENSIDAGASKISIEIEGGGIKRIAVVDNGCGISSDDLDKAFLPHTTSKISSADDLSEISTLGFRGEALSSIASVSKISVISKTIESEIGTELNFTAEKTVSKSAASSNDGTRIEVSDLFFNTPARKKFLKTPAREASEISNYVSRLILANPKIKIKYVLDGKTVYDFQGGGVEEAIFTVYGKDCLDNCLAVESSAKNVKISGYIGSPNYTKSNTTSQTVVINGRYVNCALVAAALKNAYVPYLMTRQYPFYVLYIELPYGEIDVNVHPNKLEVKFLYGQDVFMAAYLAAKDTLANASKLYKKKIEIKTESFSENEKYANVSMFPPNNASGEEFAMKLVSARLKGENNGKRPNEFDNDFEKTKREGNFQTRSNFNIGENSSRIDDDNSNDATNETQTVLKHGVRAIDEKDVRNISDKRADGDTESKSTKANGSRFADKFAAAQSEKSGVFGDTPLNFNGGGYSERQRVEQPSRLVDSNSGKQGIFSDAKFLGIVFDTYIMLERGDFLFIIDQHAAHERILYDIYMKQYETGSIAVQPLLAPYVFTVTDSENGYIKENISNFNKGGFELEEFGHNTFKLGAIPAAFAEMSLEAFVKEVLTNIRYFDMSAGALTSDTLARRACKAAVKGGDKLDRADVYALLSELDHIDNLKCPHGRPIVVVYSIVEFEKWFKRIV